MPFLDDFPDDLPFTLGEALEPLQRLHDEVETLAGRGVAGGPRLVGLGPLIRRLLEALMLGEHCLIEGYPGLAKTRTARALAQVLGLSFQRIQFVPDLMPSDLIQRERLTLDADGRPAIEWLPGPIFTNLLLADEINRASPKAQAALLEVTEERQVTALHRRRMIVRPLLPLDETKLLEDYGDEARRRGRAVGYYGEPLIDPALARGQVFVVIATMNPIEQEGVFPLSEAQLDRFAFKVQLSYPRHADLDGIAEHAFEDDEPVDGARRPEARVSREGYDHIKALYFFARLRRLLLGPSARRRWSAPENRDLREKVADLIDFTHARRTRTQGEPGLADFLDPVDGGAKVQELDRLLRERQALAATHLELARHATSLADRLLSGDYPDVLSGSSPRGLIKLIRAAHAEALLDGYLEAGGTLAAPAWRHVAAAALDVLAHRVRLTPTATARGMSPRMLIQELLQWVEGRP